MSMCRTWLKAFRATASKTTRDAFKGSAVLGGAFGYTVELADSTQFYVGRQCCRYCARAEAMSQYAARDEVPS